MQKSRSQLRLNRSGFTLVEIMVVVVIILLMLGLAIPVLHVMTGSQSEAGASNMIAGMLGRARSDAIGLQKPVGVAFIYNPSTNVESMGEVEFPICTAWVTGLTVPNGGYVSVTPNSTTVNGTVVPSPTYYYLNATGSPVLLQSMPPTPSLQSEGLSQNYLTPVFGPPIELKLDTGMQRLPSGIAIQTISNCSYSGSGPTATRITDGYLSVGVILFDGQGRLTSQPYGIGAGSLLASASGLTSAYPSPPAGSNVGIYSYLNGTYRMSSFGVPSQFGLVMFQRNQFVSQNFPTNDPAYFQQTPTPGSAVSNYTSAASGPTQAEEEAWLDINATPLLINRYTGTLVKGE